MHNTFNLSHNSLLPGHKSKKVKGQRSPTMACNTLSWVHLHSYKISKSYPNRQKGTTRTLTFHVWGQSSRSKFIGQGMRHSHHLERSSIMSKNYGPETNMSCKIINMTLRSKVINHGMQHIVLSGSALMPKIKKNPTTDLQPGYDLEGRTGGQTRY